MLAWLADENFNNNILWGWLRRAAATDVLRAQDVGLSGVSDPGVLEWAAREQRIVLTHDVVTMTRYAIDRTDAGLSMPGVVEVGTSAPVGVIIEDLLLLEAPVNPESGRGRFFSCR